MREKKTHGSWRAPVHTTLRFLGRLKHRVTKKWDKALSEGFGLISPDDSPPSSPSPPTCAPPSFPHPVPPFQQPSARPFSQPAPPWYTGQHDHEATGSNHTSNQNSEYFDTVASLEYAGQLQLPPEVYHSHFQSALLHNAAHKAQRGESVYDEESMFDELGPIDDLLNNDLLSNDLNNELLNNELYYSGELVFAESAMTSQVTETETTTIQQGMSIDTAESMEREAVMDTGTSGAGMDRSLLAPPRLSVERELRRAAGAPYEPRCKGITRRKNGKWNAEVRVSMTKVKVWLGTFTTLLEAKLAYDAGLHHCTKKKKPFYVKRLVHRLGPSIYQRVRALCETPQGKSEAFSILQQRAKAHSEFANECNQ